MQSKATFDLCHSNTPVILVETASTSDVRDKIARRFIEKLGHVSQWCEILPTADNQYVIFPLAPSELRKQAEYMLSKAEELEKQTAIHAAFIEGPKKS